MSFHAPEQEEEIRIIITDENTGEQMDLMAFLEKFGPDQAAAMLGFPGNPAMITLFEGYLEAERQLQKLQRSYQQTTIALRRELDGMNDHEFEQLLAMQTSREAVEDLMEVRDEMLSSGSLESHLIH